MAKHVAIITNKKANIYIHICAYELHLYTYIWINKCAWNTYLLSTMLLICSNVLDTYQTCADIYIYILMYIFARCMSDIIYYTAFCFLRSACCTLLIVFPPPPPPRSGQQISTRAPPLCVGPYSFADFDGMCMCWSVGGLGSLLTKGGSMLCSRRFTHIYIYNIYIYISLFCLAAVPLLYREHMCCRRADTTKRMHINMS